MAVTRAIHVRPELGAALSIVQEGGRPLRRVVVDSPALIRVQAGRKDIRCGTVSLSAQAGAIVAVSPGAEIDVTNVPPLSGPYEAECLAFDPRWCSTVENLTADAAVIAPIHAMAAPPAFLVAAFRRAFTACAETRGVPDRLFAHQLREVLLTLEISGWRFDLAAASRTSARVRRLLRAEPSRRWRIGDVGQLIGMSEATLRRRLEADGTTFRRVLRQVRMGHALVLLQSSELSVTQIADAAGYDSVSQFSAQFARHFGQSPRQLRQPSSRRHPPV